MVKRVTIKQAWDGSSTDCLNCSLRSSVLFNGLTEEDFEQIHAPVEQLTLEPGSVLYKMGERGHHLFTIRDGLVKLVQYLPDGTQRIVRLVKSTDVLGLEMMVTQHYEHEAVVLRQTRLCRYPMAAVTLLSQQNPVLHQNLMHRWQKALTESADWLTKLSTGSAKKRVANLLLLLVENNNPNACFMLSREDIGSISSITTETASRIISEFKRQQLITALARNHFDLDIAGLQAITAS